MGSPRNYIVRIRFGKTFSDMSLLSIKVPYNESDERYGLLRKIVILIKRNN